ncbi:phospholipase D-like protein [Anaerobacterium chartisolvens]|uniref:Phospholipase D-like protein n=1 Tax=Anaerobacterium chartisolvens TaxID=1297424 RepID=A0A369AIT9_9FIRM|nr:zinc ribbon domain-containing protein [Anaerobacterium chartisolvens]RCX07344.1 phospholipase D-like protein [Anaerobacterium chartisolvens]
MNNRKFFKALFWILAVAVLVCISLMMLRIGLTLMEATRLTAYTMVWLLAPIIIVAATLTAISVFVYRDAPKRGMDRWMWMTIAAFVPNLIGLIIYFIIRGSNGIKCLNCGKSIKSEFNICPYCSTSLVEHCRQCGRQVLADWKVCPYCRNDIQ